MYRVYWRWETQSVQFYEGLRLWGGLVSKGLNRGGGSAKEGPHARGGSGLGSYELRSELEVELGLGASQAYVSSLRSLVNSCVAGTGSTV